MATLTRKAFYAQLDGAPGMLFKGPNGVVFQDEATDRLTLVTPTNALHVVVLGECTLANTQRRTDVVHGGAVGVCLTRRQEVA